MSLSQGAIEGIRKGDIANEPVTLKVSASLSRSIVTTRFEESTEHIRSIIVILRSSDRSSATCAA